MSELEPGLYHQHQPLDLQAALRDLRNRAERRQLVTHSLPPDASPDIQRLVQDLQVHQIELEMQYEELLLAQSEAQAASTQYMELYDFAPVGYCTIGPDGTLLQLNLRTSQLFGMVRQQLLGRRLAVFVAPNKRNAFADFLATILERQERQMLATEMHREDGTSFYARLEGSAATNREGQQVCNLALIDITEQYQARRELEMSERRFRLLFNQNQDGMLLMRDNRFVDCNGAVLRMLGIYDRSQLLGQHASAFSPERQPNGRLSFTQAQQYWDEAIRNGHCRFEWCRNRSSGEQFWEDVLLTAIPETDGFLVHAAWRDITKEKEAARRIQESEERLQMALAASETGVWTIEYATSTVYWDARSRTIFGHPEGPNPAPYELLQAAYHPDDAADITMALQQSADDHLPLDLKYRILWPDGSVRYISAFGKVETGPGGEAQRFVGLMRDITARRKDEEELHYKNRLLEHILANLPVILSRFTTQGKYLEMAGKGLRRIGLPDNAVVGKNIFEVFPTIAEPIRHLLSGQQISFLDEQVYNGERVSFQKYGFFDTQRQQGVIFSIDVTEAEQRRAQLEVEKEFTKSLLNSTIDAVAALDTNLRTTAWNTTVADILSRTEADALGRPFAEVLPGIADDPKAMELLQLALQGQATEYPNWPGRHRPMIMDLNFVPLYTQGALSGVLLMARDVTERNALQAQATSLKLRRQQEVLSAILTTQEEERRRIAEGLHNGVGQLLYATSLHLDSLPPSEEAKTSKKLLKEAIQATRKISFELTPSILEDFGLSSALQELVKRIPPQVLATTLSMPGLRERLSPAMETVVYRAVQELLNNVMKHAKAHKVNIRITRSDDTLKVQVKDDGIGFDPDTTNRQSQGHGIGLAGIRTRVHLLGGTIEVTSRPGKGTAILLTFPVAEKA
ncbi:sensor histidine kinase [Hymenobacter tenuis]